MERLLRIIQQNRLLMGLVIIFAYLWVSVTLSPYDSQHPLPVTRECVVATAQCGDPWKTVFLLGLAFLLFHKLCDRNDDVDQITISTISHQRHFLALMSLLFDPIKLGFRKGRIQPRT